MFLMVGCQTTQSAETENKTYVVNPFENKEIPPDQVVTSSKPILCGRADAILNDIKEIKNGPVYSLDQFITKRVAQITGGFGGLVFLIILCLENYLN